MIATVSTFSNSVLVSALPPTTLPPAIAAAAVAPQEPSVPFASLTVAEREQKLMEHMAAVRFIARRIHERLPQHVEIDDLISAGSIGLMDAFTKYDASKNVQFKSYAQFRIRGAILDSLRDLDWSPRDLRRKGRAADEAVRRLTCKLGRAPLATEVAAEMNVSLAQYHQIVGELKNLEVGTLNAARNEDAGDDEINYVPGPVEDDPFLQCMKGEMRNHLAAAIEELPERERTVLSLYYFEELNMKEVGEAIGIAESRVSQIHANALLRLRTSMGKFGTRKLARRARPAQTPAGKKAAA
jgi:RNA polymerase sigma factor for flagellar operon FliA